MLGNGDSIKELYFLNLGARIIYSDLSINSVLNVKNEYDLNDYKKDIVFHAIDAFNIPLNNNSIDMIYGYAFIHHIHNLDCFFKEMYRVLKPGGICLFLDNAYSPIMHLLKWKLIPRVTNFIQKNYSTSPEDEEASFKGGYRRKEIEQLMKKHGFGDLIFFRFGLLYWIFKRFPGVIFNWSENLKNFQRNYIPFLFLVDSFFSNKSNIYNNNTIKLIFGFKK